jgi:hypothetical protein
MSITARQILSGVMRNKYMNVTGDLLAEVFRVLDKNRSGSFNKPEILSLIEELSPAAEVKHDLTMISLALSREHQHLHP